MRNKIIWFVLLVLAATSLEAQDWPQWRGPDRDGHSRETGLAKIWREEGPPELWRIEAGEGFSGVSVVGRRIFTAWRDGQSEVAVALDSRTGRELWRTRLGGVYQRERGDGPRATPSVDGARVYVLSGLGQLAALSVKDGRTIWTRDLMADLGAELPTYGFSASPLVEGNRVIVPVGGEGQALVAFNKATGEVEWSTHSDPIGYSSPVTMELAGTRQIVAVTGQSIVGISLQGEVLWSHPWPNDYHTNVASPIQVGKNRLFVSTSYDVGAVVLELRRNESGLEAVESWRNRTMKNHFQDSVYHEGYLYGFDNASLKCIDALTGEAQWRHRGGFGKGQLLFVDKQLIVLGERGRLAVARATPEGFYEQTSAELPTERYWTSPTLARGVLYVRNGKELFTLDLRAKEGSGDSNTNVTAKSPRVVTPVTAQQLVKLNLAARGSDDAWRKVEALHLTGRYNRNGRESRITVWQRASGQKRFDIVFKGRTETFIYDGARGWFRSLRGGEGGEVSGMSLLRLLGEVEAYLPWRDPWRHFETVEYAGEWTTKTQTLYRLLVDDGSAPVEWTLSASTHQVVQAIRGIGEGQFVSYEFDHRPVGGLVFPYYVEASFGTALHSLNVEAIDVNPEIPDDLFHIPRPEPQS